MIHVEKPKNEEETGELSFPSVQPDARRPAYYYIEVVYRCGVDQADASKETSGIFEYMNERDGVLVFVDGRSQRRELDKVRVVRIIIEKPWKAGVLQPRRLFY